MHSVKKLLAGATLAAGIAVLGAQSAVALPPPGGGDDGGGSGGGSGSSTTCATPVGTPGSIASLQFAKRDWPLTGGLHMDTHDGHVDRNNGGVDATTHLYNSYWGMGYTGEVTVLLRDRCGDLIGVTKPQKWGLDAKSWFWNTNERNEPWKAEMPVTVTQLTASVEVVHNRITGDPYAAFNHWRDLACKFWDQNSQQKCPVPNI